MIQRQLSLSRTNSAPQSSTGFCPFEFTVPKATKHLALRRKMAKSQVGFSADKSNYRTVLLRRVHEVSKTVKEYLGNLQFRYKTVHDAHVKETNPMIGDFVYVNRMYLEGEVSPTLAIPADRPYEVRHVYTHNLLHFKLQRRAWSTSRLTESRKYHSRRTCRTHYHSSRGRRRATRHSRQMTYKSVVEYIVTHGEDDDGKKTVKIRSHCYEDSADTCEPVG